MSTSPDTLAVGLVRCPYCGVRPGRPCTVPESGRRARYPHGARLEPVRVAWLEGYHQGAGDVIDHLEREQQRAREDHQAVPVVSLEHLRRAFT